MLHEGQEAVNKKGTASDLAVHIKQSIATSDQLERIDRITRDGRRIGAQSICFLG